MSAGCNQYEQNTSCILHWVSGSRASAVWLNQVWLTLFEERIASKGSRRHDTGWAYAVDIGSTKHLSEGFTEGHSPVT